MTREVFQFEVWQVNKDAEKIKVWIRPVFIVAIEETRYYRSCGGWCDLSIIRLEDGKEYKVVGRVARSIFGG